MNDMESVRVRVEYLAQLTRERDEARAQVERLISALERTEANFRSAVNGRPVRDMSENLAENRAAIRGDQ